MHELKLIVDLFYEGGLTKMLTYVSETAQYGDYTRGSRVVDAGTKQRMRAVLDEIQDGSFAREWTAEHAAGLPNYKAYKQADLDHQIEESGCRTARAHALAESDPGGDGASRGPVEESGLIQQEARS